MLRKTLLAVRRLLSLPAVARATPTIVAGDFVALPNTGLMSFYITTSGDGPSDAFGGADLQFAIEGLSDVTVLGFDLVNDPDPVIPREQQRSKQLSGASDS